MKEIFEIIKKLIDIFGKLNVDVDKLEDGTWKICFTIDPKELFKD